LLQLGPVYFKKSPSYRRHCCHALQHLSRFLHTARTLHTDRGWVWGMVEKSEGSGRPT